MASRPDSCFHESLSSPQGAGAFTNRIIQTDTVAPTVGVDFRSLRSCKGHVSINLNNVNIGNSNVGSHNTQRHLPEQHSSETRNTGNHDGTYHQLNRHQAFLAYNHNDSSPTTPHHRDSFQDRFSPFNGGYSHPPAYDEEFLLPPLPYNIIRSRDHSPELASPLLEQHSYDSTRASHHEPLTGRPASPEPFSPTNEYAGASTLLNPPALTAEETREVLRPLTPSPTSDTAPAGFSSAKSSFSRPRPVISLPRSPRQSLWSPLRPCRSIWYWYLIFCLCFLVFVYALAHKKTGAGYGAGSSGLLLEG